MSIEQARMIDAVVLDRVNDRAVLTITDHVDWSDPVSHLAMIDAKVATYMSSIASGEVERVYVQARRRDKTIRIHFQHPPPAVWGAREDSLRRTLGSRGVGLDVRVGPIDTR